MSDFSITTKEVAPLLEQSRELIVTEELKNDFISQMMKKGRSSETIRTYRCALNRIMKYLPENQKIDYGTMDSLLNQMMQNGASVCTMNITISVANSLFEYCNRRDLKMPKIKQSDLTDKPTLTKVEVQRLLLAARRQGKERTYLLVKVFGYVGIDIARLQNLTVDAVRAGFVITDNQSDGTSKRRLPPFLCEELENYIQRENIVSGPIFISQNGNPLSRSTVSSLVADLSKEAHVARNKCNPCCLQNFYNNTRKDIERDISLQVEHIYELQLEQEQRIVGWTARTTKSNLSD